MKKIYVNSKHQVTITCDHCGGTRTGKVPMHIRGNTPVIMRCQCGNDMQVVFEFRQTYRKPTSLRGRWLKQENEVRGQTAKIHNLSRDGLQFTTQRWGDIRNDDILTLSFQLDDPQRSGIHKQLIVKHIDKQVVGGQFSPEDQQSHQKEIGFYLMG